MSYLIYADLKRLIQSDNLMQIVGSDLSLIDAAQRTAQEEAYTHLIQKYDTSSEFTDTNQWDPAIVYKAANRIYLDAAVYNSASTYALGALVLQSGNVYSCSTAIIVPEVFTVSRWTLLGKQFEVFYGKYPETLFNLQGAYNVGDKVFWKDKTYTAISSTRSFSHDVILQYDNTYSIANSNFFPDDPVDGARQWGSAVAYSIAAATLPTDATKWTKGDNRSQALVMYITDIALYHLHSRIAPKSIPDLRVKRYDDAISNLKGYAKGHMTANLTKIQPPQGKRIRWGSNIKQNNNY